MIGSTTSNTLWTRIAVALAWRRNEDVARKLAGFAATEAGSALDMLKAAEICDDPNARRLFFRHALDEARHAELFQQAARSLSPDAAQWNDYAVIHATRQNLLATLGFIRFLAFVYIAESKAAQQFDALARRFADQPEIADLFSTVLKDERFHVAYSKHLLDELTRQGRGPEVRAALRRVRWGGAWQAWRRAGRRIGDVLARGVLLTLYVTVVPVFAVIQRLFEGNPRGWQTPAKPPRSLAEGREAVVKVLGISAYFHDSAAALVIDGEVVAAAQEERFSRLKNDARLPKDAIRFCLRQSGLRLDEIDHVVFYEKPLRKFERILVTHLREFPRSAPQFTHALGKWLTKRLWLKGEMCAELGCTPEQLLFLDHHLSHAASAFLCSPHEHAAVLTVDGVGEHASTTIYEGRGSSIEPLEEIRFPDSIGLLYSAITAYLGFRVNHGEYKVMGLAPYGEPRFAAEFEKLCHIGEDGSFRLDPRYFAYARSADRSFTPLLEDLLGPARVSDDPIELPRSQRFADVAASLQQITERAMLALARRAKERTGASALCLAGGVALNSVANRKIAQSGIFEHVFVQPAAGDAGGALGAALYVDHAIGGTPRRNTMQSALLGEGWDSREIRLFLADCRVRHEHHPDRAKLNRDIAKRLATGDVGGWFQGRFEWGPRALGARSILADARDPRMADRVNAKIKFREAFRPFAPAVRAAEASRWFDVGRDAALTRFMLSVAPVTAEGRKTLPATTHVDGTARVQTVDAEASPRFAGLLDAFAEETGVGVLLNTSMNLKGEPLCASPAEAYGVFQRSALDFLVLEDCVVTKRASRKGAPS